MNDTAISEDRLQSQIESALATSDKTLQAIAFAAETEALEGALLDDVLNLKERINGLAIFATDEHFAVMRVADRLEPVILAATTVHYLSAEEWDINPPSEEKVVERYGLAAIDLRSLLRDLAEQLAGIQNMLKAERIAADLRGDQA
ncbi:MULTISPECIES: hypothetical protein [Sulfitobacter]|uniref:Uncharacterized protein n=1 Tax=Sulfitobacter profundi TaxID=2679961 RepID=A0ABW1YV79_9RHOB|nr:hypothetical protein [Sulfitobacter indolifex]